MTEVLDVLAGSWGWSRRNDTILHTYRRLFPGILQHLLDIVGLP
jgi:hypothetical protein